MEVALNMYPWGVNESFFFKVTYSKEFKRLHIYSYGCNFNCKWCYYRLKTPVCSKRLHIDEIVRVVDEVHYKYGISKIHLLGGEPTINPDLDKVIELAKSYGIKIKLFTNGYNEIPKGVDEVNISIRLMDNEKHIKYTGRALYPILNNLINAYNEGIRIYVTTIYIPDLNYNDILKLAEFISRIDPNIPLHIIGYIPVPKAPWRKPSNYEMLALANRCKKILRNVTWSNVSVSYTHLTLPTN